MKAVDPRKAFEDKILELGNANERIVAVSCDSAAGGGLAQFFKALPKRSIECGISEQTAVSICASMSTQGFIPVLVVINPFLTMRAYEQVRDDLGYVHMNVKIVGSGGGLAYSTLGASHIAIEDIALMRTIPNLTILAPGDADEVTAALEQAILIDGPVYIRMPRQARPAPKPIEERNIVLGKAEVLTQGDDIAVFTYGPSVDEAMGAACLLKKQGVNVSVINFTTLAPFDKVAVLKATLHAKLLVTLEEHILFGGIGTAVCETLADAGVGANLLRIAIPEGSKQTGPYEELVHYYGLSADKVAAAIIHKLNI